MYMYNDYSEFLTTSIIVVVLEIFNKSRFNLFPVLYEWIQHVFKCFFIKLTFHNTNSLVYLKLIRLCDFWSNVVSPGSKFNIMHCIKCCAFHNIRMCILYIAIYTNPHAHTQAFKRRIFAFPNIYNNGMIHDDFKYHTYLSKCHLQSKWHSPCPNTSCAALHPTLSAFRHRYIAIVYAYVH